MSLGRIVGALAVGALLALGSTGVASAAPAPAPVALGSAGAFAVLAGTTVTSAETVAGASTVNGDLGVSPGTSVTGFPPATLNGALHAGDGPAASAHTDLATAYTDASERSSATPITADIGGTTLDPGVYQAAAASIAITGTLTLDAQGDPNAVFILQAGSTLITAAKSQVILANGAQACNVFWSVGSSANARGLLAADRHDPGHDLDHGRRRRRRRRANAGPRRCCHTRQPGHRYRPAVHRPAVEHRAGDRAVHRQAG